MSRYKVSMLMNACPCASGTCDELVKAAQENYVPYPIMHVRTLVANTKKSKSDLPLQPAIPHVMWYQVFTT
jgi:hypothetical protein